MTSEYKHIKKYREKRKITLVESFGGKCVICGYNKCNRALSFHHIDSNNKEFTLSTGDCKSLESVCDEASKCVMLCSNCHMELHDGLIEINSDHLTFDKALFIKLSTSYRIEFDKCPICGTEKSINRKTCSVRCSSNFRSKIDWNLIDLVEMNKTTNIPQISKELGISESVIRKRLKRELGVLAH